MNTQTQEILNWNSILPNFTFNKGYPIIDFKKTPAKVSNKTFEETLLLSVSKINKNELLAIFIPVSDKVPYDGSVGVDIYSNEWKKFVKFCKKIDKGNLSKLKGDLNYISTTVQSGIPGFIIYINPVEFLQWKCDQNITSILSSRKTLEVGLLSFNPAEFVPIQLDCDLSKIQIGASLETAKIVNNFLHVIKKTNLENIPLLPCLTTSNLQATDVIHFKRPAYK